ncbi:MAG: DUF126 domain-containing protein [bacterium]|nr:DUF126 domain-containing protein [bacterium]MDE0290409.1 DUF126 domain-containing protein [bacterium]MDE0437827.1 DUF126 domain-containing protein [bacterium]
MNGRCRIAARGIVPGKASGPALVSSEGISFLGDLDIRTGRVVNRTHEMRGRSVAGTVLVLPHSVGSAGAWRFLYQLQVHGTHPVAIVQNSLPDSSLVQGAILGGIPIVCEPELDVTTAIRSGDVVEVDGAAGTLSVRRVDSGERT